jgi:hypothetical protein
MKTKIENGHTIIKCPGCKTFHTLNTDPSKKPCWGFNGDFEKPTFSPSILERSGHCSGHFQGDIKDCYFCKEGLNLCYVCHSFVRDGMIQFLSDCTHELAGKTVPLEDID